MKIRFSNGLFSSVEIICVQLMAIIFLKIINSNVNVIKICKDNENVMIFFLGYVSVQNHLRIASLESDRMVVEFFD